MRQYRMVGLAFAVLVWPITAQSGETDQYLVWGVTLEDSAPAMNRYLNDEIADYLKSLHNDVPPSSDEVTKGTYRHLFRGLHASKLRNFLQHSEDIDRYPPKTVSFWQYQNMSIYRGRSFPYILPMSRTIRVGEVYCGIDKFAHFFGFGRHSYRIYRNAREDGLDEDAAIGRVVRISVRWENTRVGRIVDGIFSHADIEASFQGFLLARDLCAGDDPYVKLIDGYWTLVRPIDIRDYVTPDFDESYNPSHYWLLRKRFVLPLLEEEYAHRLSEPAVQKRFARYRQYEPSESVRLIREHFRANGGDVQARQYRTAFGVPPRTTSARPSTSARAN
ncbi:MAG: hypothetical protein AMXMBFR82_21730 [Candidatus Hydrogenedentota bacterium]